jgi:small subunit ribosomal protein S15e
MISEELKSLFPSKIKRKIRRGLKKKYAKFIMKVRKSVKECQPGEKPKVVKTHYRNMIIGTTFFHFY